ncbi:hypothetical protein BDZ45DRAFT_809365 [Acephala macrosclerotiorum]|nr:hypothetical protein BDZ45DRAFT_809365 [Acephala macrosclerotiorum]
MSSSAYTPLDRSTGYRSEVSGKRSSPSPEVTTAEAKHDVQPHYVCNKAFTALLVLISILLLIAAVATIALKSLTLAPDILGYVSSNTRHNEYCGVNPASRLTRLERARTIEKVVVRIGDVKGDSEVGHIAFATGDEEIRLLRRNKLCD